MRHEIEQKDIARDGTSGFDRTAIATAIGRILISSRDPVLLIGPIVESPKGSALLVGYRADDGVHREQITSTEKSDLELLRWKLINALSVVVFRTEAEMETWIVRKWSVASVAAKPRIARPA